MKKNSSNDEETSNKLYPWPEGEFMHTTCPNCNENIAIQLSSVRAWNLPERPCDCLHCDSEFVVSYDGKFEIILATPRESTEEGRALLKKLLKNPLTFRP